MVQPATPMFCGTPSAHCLSVLTETLLWMSDIVSSPLTHRWHQLTPALPLNLVPILPFLWLISEIPSDGESQDPSAAWSGHLTHVRERSLCVQEWSYECMRGLSSLTPLPPAPKLRDYRVRSSWYLYTRICGQWKLRVEPKLSSSL